MEEAGTEYNMLVSMLVARQFFAHRAQVAVYMRRILQVMRENASPVPYTGRLAREPLIIHGDYSMESHRGEQ